MRHGTGKGAPFVCAVIVVLLALLTAPVSAGLAEGQAAYLRGDYQVALREFLPLAKQGVAQAQRNLGLMYANGQGVPQDYAEAAKWYRRAADQGDALAQSDLGGMYSRGLGVPQDYAEAAKWYRRAADQGHARAQWNLGMMYDGGHGCRRTMPKPRSGTAARPTGATLMLKTASVSSTTTARAYRRTPSKP
jgi:uncharacterized protein